MLVSQINKNLESLSIYYEYKLFLDQLAPKEVREEMERRKQELKRRKEEMERREHLNSSSGKNIGGGQGGKHSKKESKKAAAAAIRGPGASDADNDVQIPNKLREVIEESDDDYPIHFDESEELLEMFATLEEQNLFLI